MQQTANDKLIELFSVPLAMSNQQRKLREQVLKKLQEFLCNIKVCTDVDIRELSSSYFDTNIPEETGGVDTYFEFLLKDIIHHSINMSSPRCLGHMSGIVLNFMGLLSEIVISLNQNLVKSNGSKVLALLERQTLGALHRLIYKYPENFYQEHIQKNGSTLGIMCSGGTIANITALWCARNSVFKPFEKFQGVEKEGIAAALCKYGYEKAVVLGSNLMHYSIDKAASVLGIGEQNVIKISVDQQNCIELDELEERIKECVRRRWRVLAIIGMAGTTDCGSIDSLSGLADIAKRERVHFHVDAAWGAPLLFSQLHRNKLDGLESADSVTFDAHKQLYMPIGVSMLLMRNPYAAKVFEKQANYILQEDSSDLGKFSLEGSRSASVCYVHAALNIVGRQGYEHLVNENIHEAKFMAKLIRKSDNFELLFEPQTNILLYRYIPERWRCAVLKGHLTSRDNEYLNGLNIAIQKAQYEGGNTLVSRTQYTNHLKYKGLPIIALRVVIGNPLTSEEDIKSVLMDQIQIAVELEKRGGVILTYRQ